MSLQFESLIQSLTRFLSSEKIPYVIIGGIAVSIYGEPRMTLDVDINVVLDKAKAEDFLKKIKKFGFSPSFKETMKIVKKTGVIPLKFQKGNILGKLDVIIAENSLEFSAIRRGRIKKIDNLKIKLISPEDLIIHKIASTRAKDYEDLKGIIQRQKKKIDVTYIQEWLKKLDEVGGDKLLQSFNRLLSKA